MSHDNNNIIIIPQAWLPGENILQTLFCGPNAAYRTCLGTHAFSYQLFKYCEKK